MDSSTNESRIKVQFFFVEVVAASGGGLGDVEWPRWVEILEGISHTLITVNSSLNFFIYLVI